MLVENPYHRQCTRSRSILQVTKKTKNYIQRREKKMKKNTKSQHLTSIFIHTIHRNMYICCIEHWLPFVCLAFWIAWRLCLHAAFRFLEIMQRPRPACEHDSCTQTQVVMHFSHDSEQFNEQNTENAVTIVQFWSNVFDVVVGSSWKNQQQQHSRGTTVKINWIIAIIIAMLSFLCFIRTYLLHDFTRIHRTDYLLGSNKKK